MGQRTKVREFDNSLNDFIEKVRSAFEKQFNSLLPVNPMGTRTYFWTTDIFEGHVIAREDTGGKYYRVEFTLDENDVPVFTAREEWEAVKLSYISEMGATQFREIMFISEFKGKYPKVPTASGVDYDALVAGDGDPVFVTLPIGLVGAKSRNKRYYDEAFVTELEKQVLATKPIGIMGHLTPEQRMTEFPTEAIHWVGAMRVGELLWGKGYVPPGESRDRLQRYKATNKRIATSIDAIAEGIWEDSLNAYRMQAKSLKLAQIDIAPADRAGIAGLAVVPHFTTEMATGVDDEPTQEEFQMDKLQVINEMTAADARLLPTAVQEAILATVPVRPEIAQVQAIREALGITGDADPVTVITEMRTQQDDARKKAITDRITEVATSGEKAIKLVSARPLVMELVSSRQPKTVEDVDRIYGEVIEMAQVKTFLQATVQERMGPALGKAVGSPGAGASLYWDDAPVEEKA